MKRLFASAMVLAFPMQALAAEQCNDLLIHFVDESDVGKSMTKAFQNRKLSALIPCGSAGLGNLGAQLTLMHFMEHDGTRLCVTERSCGNVESWYGYFGLAVGWSDLTLFRDFWVFAKSARVNSDWNGYQLVAMFALAQGQIERDCSTLRPPSCVEIPDVSKNDDLSWK
ncbi:MAG: hypothetical protein FJY29_11765 [Betaproteobacteria bacterium]|nr:hypothetical protein [Betaproteobacteria bacterium]